VELYNLTGAAIAAAGYARLAVANNATSFPAAAGGLKSNGTDWLFPEATSDWGDIGGAALYDAATAGWQIIAGFLGPAGVPFTAKSSDTIAAPGHTLVVGDKVRLLQIGGAALPAPLAVGTTYFVLTVAADDITLSLTSGGAVVDLTGVGSGRIGKFLPKVVNAGDQFSLPAGQFTWAEA
jgi:hypothetical protein